MLVLNYDNKCLAYPNRNTAYSPSHQYPEYPWDDISQTDNHVYEMVRSTFILAGLDIEHLGTTCWNPLGVYIMPGKNVMVKPNWVENKNKCKGLDEELSCLITNPSIVRAVLDYVIIALAGKGCIYLADAPMQGYQAVCSACRFNT